MSEIWIPIAVALISLLGVIIVPLLTSKRTQRLTKAQLDKLESDRKAEDDKRNETLRERWQATTEDVDYLWGFYQDQILPWMREAHELLRPEHPEFRKPPALKSRPHKEIREQTSERSTQTTEEDDD